MEAKEVTNNSRPAPGIFRYYTHGKELASTERKRHFFFFSNFFNQRQMEATMAKISRKISR
jgi:hypothetical protein